MTDGEAMPTEVLWRYADGWFRDRMSPDWKPKTDQEAEELFESLGMNTEFFKVG